jgi:hypothetical protein
MDEGVRDEPRCFECGAPCIERDLIWLIYWCSACVKRSFEKYEKGILDA